METVVVGTGYDSHTLRLFLVFIADSQNFVIVSSVLKMFVPTIHVLQGLE